jgi:hypothetical protein
VQDTVDAERHATALGELGFSEVPSPLQEVEKWIRRRLRCYLWKQWGRRGYRSVGVGRRFERGIATNKGI